MSDVKIINFSDIKKIRDAKLRKEDDFWQNIADLINDDAGDIFLGNGDNTDISWPEYMADESSSPMESIAKFLIRDLTNVGLNPAKDEIADDMVILTMLYQAAAIEHMTDAWKTSGGEENAFYRWFDKIRTELNKAKDTIQ